MAKMQTFIVAESRNDMETIQELIRTDPTFSNQYMLRIACIKVRIDIMNVLLEDPRVDPSIHDNVLLKQACQNGRTKVVERLLQHPKVDPSAGNQEPLKEAVKAGHTDIVRMLLQDPRVDPSVYHQEVLGFAIEKRNLELTKLLLRDPRIDPSLFNQSVLRYAVKLGFADIIETLLQDPRVDPSFNDQQLLKTAIENDDVDTARELLKDPRVDPSVRMYDMNQGILAYAINKADVDMVKLLLLHPNVDPSVDYQFAIRTAVMNGYLPIVAALLHDPRVDPTIHSSGQMPIIVLACKRGNLDIVRLLLEDTRINSDPAIFEMAKQGKFRPYINEFVLSMEPFTPWLGFSRGDMEKLDSIFSEDANNYSCCPVCLRYVQRADGCMYMSHNCFNEPGANTVDEYWYNMYKNNEGLIYWCTICGRICLGHRHYMLGATKNKLDLVPLRPGADPFAKDCAGEGGGGIQEKLVRFTAFRELAYELQKEVGKISRKKALEELVQEMWSAPISRLSLRRAKNNLTAKKFRLPANAFPVPVVSNNAPNIVRNARNAELLPTVGPGYNNISTTDDDAVIQFHHRKSDGELNNHESNKINTESFRDYIQSNLNDGKAGPCWLPTCTAIIHPDEIKELVRLGVFPDTLYKRYKDAFNRVQRGGGGDVLQEAFTARCVLWEKKSVRKTRRNRKNRRNTRKYK